MAEKHESFAMPFHISVVHGDTIINGKADNATLGIDKGYRVNSLLGLGAVIKYAWGELELNYYTFAHRRTGTAMMARRILSWLVSLMAFHFDSPNVNRF